MISVGPWTSSVCAAIVLAALFAACAKEKEAPAAAATSAAATPAAGTAATSAGGGAASPSADLGGAPIHLKIVGGAHAGTLDPKGTLGCYAGTAGPGSWHLMWGGGDPNDRNSLNSVTLDVPAAAGGGAAAFTLQVFFGSGDDTSGFVVNTLAASGGRGGKGTVTVADRGPSAAVTLDATTTDGVRLQGTFDCPVLSRQ